jgi:uncharacterized protein (DUF2384 family)
MRRMERRAARLLLVAIIAHLLAPFPASGACAARRDVRISRPADGSGEIWIAEPTHAQAQCIESDPRYRPKDALRTQLHRRAAAARGDCVHRRSAAPRRTYPRRRWINRRLARAADDRPT